MVSRLKLQYCKIVLATSLVWFLLDVVLLMYYTDCATNAATDCNGGHKGKETKAESGSLLKRILPKGLLSRSSMPGDMGKAVSVPAEKEEEAKEKFKIHQFNLIASDMMSLNRTLPDYRIPGCRNKKYPPVSVLPDTSVVVVFHNEAWSTLLRTVHSVINRSPKELLNEIILVDDASERGMKSMDIVKENEARAVDILSSRKAFCPWTSVQFRESSVNMNSVLL